MANHTHLSLAGQLLIGAALLSSNLLHAQSPCDSIAVVSVSYAPFNDTAMHVVLRHSGAQFLSYPRAWLVDQAADTVAREGLTLFGLSGPTESMHYLHLDPGTAVPPTPFSGEVLFFFSDIDGDHYCSLPVNTPLCPAACMPLQVFVYPHFGSVTNAVFPWSMRDSTGTAVGTGTLNIDEGVLQDIDSLCLTPGPYTLHVEQPVPAGEAFQVGVVQLGFLSGTPVATLPAGGTVDVPFNYYPSCFERHTGLVEPEPAAPVISLHDRMLTITHPEQRPLGDITLFDATGRCVARASAKSSSLSMDLASLAAGVHLIRVHNTHSSVQRIVVP